MTILFVDGIMTLIYISVLSLSYALKWRDWKT